MGTSRKDASLAAKILSSPKSTAAQKTVAASDLTQYKTDREITGKKAASAASKILSSPKSTAAQKSVAGSDLTQRQGAYTGASRK